MELNLAGGYMEYYTNSCCTGGMVSKMQMVTIATQVMLKILVIYIFNSIWNNAGACKCDKRY